MCSWKKTFCEISHNSQENTCARVFDFQCLSWNSPPQKQHFTDLPSLIFKIYRKIHSVETRCFPVNFAKIFLNSFLSNTSRWLIFYFTQIIPLWNCLEIPPTIWSKVVLKFCNKNPIIVRWNWLKLIIRTPRHFQLKHLLTFHI